MAAEGSALASRPTLGPERWRLRGATGARALERWTEILDATHLRFDVRQTPRTPSKFHGFVSRQRLGDLVLVDCASSPFLGHRGSSVMGQRPEPIFGFQCVRKGVERVRESSRELDLRAGDVILWDGLVPVDVEVIEPFVKRTLIFPRESVLAVCPQVDDLAALPPLGHSPSARLLARYLDALAAELPMLDNGGREAAADAALELLRAALAPSLPSSRSARRAARCAEVRRFVRTHLGDPSLGPESIARGQAMSVRALHALFEDTGESVGALVRRERLTRCLEDLRLPNGGSVTEIAFRWGFRDAAHFARVFKQRFGVTPSDVRRAAGRRRAPSLH